MLRVGRTTVRSWDRLADQRSRVKISAILVVTGASGSGKTTTVRALEARALPGVRCYYFDAVGVPATEALERQFGSPESWQAVTTRAWLDRLAANPDSADVYVLDGQTRPSLVRSAVERVGTVLVRVVLLDCAAHARHVRLAGPRGQPELSNPRMYCWAAYLRGQADALELPVIDTTNLGIDAAVDALIVHVERLKAERAAAEQQAGAVRLDAGRPA
jgi:hypothetical protein